ncbi:MAG: hypothetical protein V1738_02115 [Patescibacteria group bacterium]
MEKEICICAAVKTKSGLIIRCHRHNFGRDVIMGMPNEELDKSDNAQGFMTSRNRFVDRAEGLALQKAAGIPTASRIGHYLSELYSEDLY